MIRTLSGFLGLPSDWDFLPWPHEPLDPSAGGAELRPEDVLMGYSMGGRLALRILEHRSVRCAVIISGGLNAPDPSRRARDETWATRFETEPWEVVHSDWQAQDVLSGHSVTRREEDYDRSLLARQLREYSPAVLPPPALERIETPVLWIAGERDERYVAVARAAADRLPNAELWICPASGHRVPWERPDALVTRLRTFLDLH